VKAVRLIPKEDTIVFGNLNSFKPARVDISSRVRICVDIFFDMDHLTCVLVKEITRKVDMT
jgi:hypothetical protein